MHSLNSLLAAILLIFSGITSTAFCSVQDVNVVNAGDFTFQIDTTTLEEVIATFAEDLELTNQGVIDAMDSMSENFATQTQLLEDIKVIQEYAFYNPLDDGGPFDSFRSAWSDNFAYYSETKEIGYNWLTASLPVTMEEELGGPNFTYYLETEQAANFSTVDAYNNLFQEFPKTFSNHTWATASQQNEGDPFSYIALNYETMVNQNLTTVRNTLIQKFFNDEFLETPDTNNSFAQNTQMPASIATLYSTLEHFNQSLTPEEFNLTIFGLAISIPPPDISNATYIRRSTTFLFTSVTAIAIVMLFTPQRGNG